MRGPGEGAFDGLIVDAEHLGRIPVQYDFQLRVIGLQATGNQTIGVAQFGNAHLRDQEDGGYEIEKARVCQLPFRSRVDNDIIE